MLDLQREVREGGGKLKVAKQNKVHGKKRQALQNIPDVNATFQ